MDSLSTLRPAPWLRVQRGRAWLLLGPLAACCGQPTGERDVAVAAEASSFPGLATDYRSLVDEDGVHGGELRIVLDAPPEEVVDLLLDFEHAAGHRAWAETFEVLERDGDRVVATWHFRGRLGIRPTIDLAFERSGAPPDVRIDFETVKGAFGLETFQGFYRVQAAPAPAHGSLVTMRVYLDSGLPFVNASDGDIEDGLRADARRLEGWLSERTSRGG